jgi:uncharacterized membrane protein YccC
VGVDVRAQQVSQPTFIPPEPKAVSPRDRIRGLALGAIVGAFLGVVVWLTSGTLLWLLAMPVCGVYGWLVPRNFLRPNVLWGRHAE